MRQILRKATALFTTKSSTINTRLLTRRVFLVVLALLMSLSMPDVAQAIDKQFFNNNDIIWYDPDLVCDNAASNGLTNVTPEVKIAQTFIVGFDPGATDQISAAVEKYKLGGVFPVGGSDNSKLTKEFFDSLTTKAGAKVFIAADDEGGQVARFTKNTTPSAEEMGKMSADQAKQKGAEAGSILTNAGLNADLAPVLDIANPGTPWTATQRDWSSDPKVITANAGAFAEGLATSGITPVYKHFPGIGSVTENTDFGKTTPQKLSDLTDDIQPYRDLANKNNGAVMLSNGYVEDWGNTPVSINSNAVSYLRNDVKFTGTIMTDALNALSQGGYGSDAVDLTSAIVDAMNAGVDMPLFIPGGDMDGAINDAIQKVKSSVPQTVIDAAYAKSLSLRKLQEPTQTATSATAATNSSTASVCCVTAGKSGSVTLSGKDNREKILAYLMGKGLTLAQATGVTGNFQVESFSDIKVNAQEIGKWPLGGFGIAQWTGGRRTNLVNFLTEKGVIDLYKDGNEDLAPADNDRLLAVELDFFWQEEEGPEAASLAALKAITGNTEADAREAARTFERVHERCSPSNGESACDVPKRMDYAAEAFNLYSDQAALPGSGGTAATAPTTQPVGTTTGATSGSTVIAIDPGHGGGIPDYIDETTKLMDRETTNSPEREDVLDVANDVKTQLEQAGYTVVMLRTGADEVVSKRQRVDKAIAAKANLAISIHTAPGTFNEVWPQRVGTSRSYNGTTVTFTNETVAKQSQTYADAIASARKTSEGHDISLDPNNSAQDGSFNRDDVPSKGNISLVQLWGQDIPWVYNEISQDGPGASITADTKTKYAAGIVNGIKAALPTTGTGASTGSCSTNGTVSGGATGNKIADFALSLAWPNKGKHDGQDKSLARDTYQVEMPKYNSDMSEAPWTDCGLFVSTVIKGSGADPNYPTRGTGPAQLPYVQSQVTFRAFQPKDTSELKPGMLAVLSGHTYIYTGPYTGDDGESYDIAQASLYDHPPEAGHVYLSDSRGPYTFGELK